MKKVLMFCLVMVLAFSMSLTVAAVDGGFISSPSNEKAPVLVNYKNESEDCTAELVLCSYADRANLSDEARAAIEEAYAQIKGTYDLSTLTVDLAKIALELGVPVTHLSVTDLFDISCSEDEDHDGHGKFTIELTDDSFQSYACLLHYMNGEWVIVENAKLSESGRTLSFEVDEFSPFAIVGFNGGKVVRTEVEVEVPAAVNNVLVAVSSGSTVAAIATTIWALSERKKNNAKQKEESDQQWLTF